jgi:uncharacterized protein YllA (UPF0747 family)
MRGLIKLGMMAAAAYGAYEIARRYGLIEKAANWLDEQIPEDMKERARQMSEQVREGAHQFTEQVKERAGQVSDKVVSGAERAIGAASDGASRFTDRGSEQTQQ